MLRINHVPDIKLGAGDMKVNNTIFSLMDPQYKGEPNEVWLYFYTVKIIHTEIKLCTHTRSYLPRALYNNIIQEYFPMPSKFP